jgi:hypothetical protein
MLRSHNRIVSTQFAERLHELLRKFSGAVADELTVSSKSLSAWPAPEPATHHAQALGQAEARSKE